MKLYKTLLLLSGLLLLAGCEKMPSDGLAGKWKPVYVCFDTEDVLSGYRSVYDGPVDAHGGFTQLLIGMDHPDVQYENQARIAGIRFFKNGGEDVFTTFFLDTPNKAIEKPLLYKIENGKLFFELPKGAFINCSPEVLQEGSGVFDEGSEFAILPDGQLKIGTDSDYVLYKRL